MRSLLALLLLVPTAVSADPILNISGGQLTGASGVVVADSLYTVSFVDGTCLGLFDGCDEASDFAFQDLSTAEEAARALSSLIVDSPLGLFDTLPNTTSGCESALDCFIFTPYSIFEVGRPVQAAFVNAGTEDLDRFASYVTTAGFDSTGSDRSVWALWERTGPVSVPEPGTLALFGLGLASIGIARRSRKA